MGWLLVDNPAYKSRSGYARYAADLCRDRFHLRLEQRVLWMAVWAVHVLLFYMVGFAAGWLATGSWLGGVQLGLSWLVWGVLVRTVVVWHITVVDQFGDAPVGLSQLSDARRQPQ